MIAHTFPLPFLSSRRSTNLQVHVLLAAVAALCLAPTTSIAALIPLSPSSVIGGSGSLNDGGDRWDATDPGGQEAGFNATRVVDGNLAEDSDLAFWLDDTDTGFGEPAYFVLDLGDTYNIDQIDLYNTNNRGNNNYGTKDFRILASNSVSFVNADLDMDLSGNIETLLDSTLGDTDSQNPPLVQTRAVSHTGNFRYMKFVEDGGLTGGAYADNRRGLNEIVLFGVQTPAIPEPSTLVLAVFGLLGFTRPRGK